MPSPKRGRMTPVRAVLCAMAAASLLLASPAATGQSATLTAPASHPAAAHRHKRHHHHSPPKRTVTPAVVTPPPPPAPADQSPSAATVSFTNGMLTIQARNSSLEQILNQVSQQTGMAIEGYE